MHQEVTSYRGAQKRGGAKSASRGPKKRSFGAALCMFGIKKYIYGLYNRSKFYYCVALGKVTTLEYTQKLRGAELKNGAQSKHILVLKNICLSFISGM